MRQRKFQRPQLPLKEEINLLAARTYVCSRLFDTEELNKSEAEDQNSNRRSRRDELRLFPSIPRPACLDKMPDLTCRELDIVYHALIRANSRHPGTEANRDPSLVRCCDRDQPRAKGHFRALNAIRKRFNMEEVRIQG